jgi:hypothetical protein
LEIRLSLTLFCLNETTRFVQNDAVSCTILFFFKKKDAQNNVVLYGTVHLLLLPLKRIDKGRRRFYLL